MTATREDNIYKKYLDTAIKLENKRMGYPLTGSVNGFFNGQRFQKSSTHHKMIDRSLLGIEPNSLSDVLLLAIGDPETSQVDEEKRHQNDIFYPEDIENEVIQILARHFKTDQSKLKGYVTSGGTESSLACVWWLRDHLSHLVSNTPAAKQKIAVFASSQSHYSCVKICRLLNLDLFQIEALSNGSVDVAKLAEAVQRHMQKDDSSPMIFWLNAGTTVLGAVDDFAGVKAFLEKNVKAKNGLYGIHTDGAILGITLPLLYPKVADLFEFTDTLSLSGHKILATAMACGVALSKRHVIEGAFSEKDISIGYVHNVQDITVSGGRSASAIFQLHHSLRTFGIHEKSETFKQLISGYLENVSFLKDGIAGLIGAENVIVHPNQFNVIFPLIMEPEHRLELKEKYTLMSLPDNKVCLTVFANVDKNLILEFLNDYKKYFLSTTPKSAI